VVAAADAGDADESDGAGAAVMVAGMVLGARRLEEDEDEEEEEEEEEEEAAAAAVRGRFPPAVSIVSGGVGEQR
jgi:hypothetical protein